MPSTLSNKLPSVVGVTLIVVLLDLLLVFYVMSHGFGSTTNQIQVAGVSMQLAWLPLVGVAILSLAASYDAFTRIFPRWLGPEADPMAKLRFLRAVTLTLLVFGCILYVPYLLGSNWLWSGLSNASHAIGQFQGFGTWLEQFEMPVLSMAPVLQYSVTQVLACAALVFFTWILARPARRPKKLR